MNQDDVGVLRGLRKRVRHRILPPGAAGDDRDRPADRGAERLRSRIDVLVRERDDDFLDAIAGRQRRDAQLEDGSAADLEELLGPVGAEAHSSAACGDNGGNVHAV